MGSIPGLGRSPEVENGNLLQHPYLEYPMNRGAWWATAHGGAKSQTGLSTAPSPLRVTHDVKLAVLTNQEITNRKTQFWNRSPAQVGCKRQVLRAGALGRPRGTRWRGRQEEGSGWGTHVDPWLIHVNVWQKTLQYKKKKKERKKK